MGNSRIVPCLLFAALSVPTAQLLGQEVGSLGADTMSVTPEYAPGAPQYGTAGLTALVVNALNFVPYDDSATWGTSVSGSGVFRTRSSADWWAGVNVPNGARIERVDVDACDDSATGQLLFGLTRASVPAGSAINVTPVGATGGAATPGCALYSVTPTSPPLVVDNANNNYVLFLNHSGDATNALRSASMRVLYRLQVSPAPLVATFSDVPTDHSFFRFVEALAAAGITGGCGAGIYCPNNPVTRGQMAVFLSVALGLHFPN